MPIHPDAEVPADSLLCADDGTPLARFRIRADDEKRVAGQVQPLPGAALSRVAAQARHDLAGLCLETPDEGLAEALVAGGLELCRSATDMRHDLADLPTPVTLSDGWSLGAPGWDDELADGLAAAYGPQHPDGAWQTSDTEQIRAMFDDSDPVSPLVGASARLLDPDGRSAGHVLCAGPVPWTDDGCAWILNLAVAPHAQGRGCGRALLIHALRGTRQAGLPSLGLSVADGNHARRMYDNTGFRPLARMLSILLPPS